MGEILSQSNRSNDFPSQTCHYQPIGPTPKSLQIWTMTIQIKTMITHIWAYYIHIRTYSGVVFDVRLMISHLIGLHSNLLLVKTFLKPRDDGSWFDQETRWIFSFFWHILAPTFKLDDRRLYGVCGICGLCGLCWQRRLARCGAAVHTGHCRECRRNCTPTIWPWCNP